MRFNPVAGGVFFALLSSSSCFACDLLKLTISDAERGLDQYGSSTMIYVRLADSSAQQFAGWTARHVGEKIEISIDGRVVSQPKLLMPIRGEVFPFAGVSTDEIDDLIPKLADGKSILAVKDNEPCEPL